MVSEKYFSLNEMSDLAEQIKILLKKPQALLLCGLPGTGKTTLTTELLKKWETKIQISSPAFSITNSYQVDENVYNSDQESQGQIMRKGTQSASLVHHVDLYRLKDDEDLESTGFWDVFSNKEDLVIIEWADRLNQKCLPPDWNYIQIEFTFVPDQSDSRFITIKGV